MGRQMAGMVENMNSQANANSNPMFDPRFMEGANNPQAMNFGGAGQSIGSQEVSELSGGQAFTSAI